MPRFERKKDVPTVSNLNANVESSVSKPVNSLYCDDGFQLDALDDARADDATDAVVQYLCDASI